MSGQRLNINIETKLSQKLLITPQMKQSLSLLQMPITDLVQEVNTYLEENPALEIAEPDYDDMEPERDADASDADGDVSDKSLLEEISDPEWSDYIGDDEELSFTPLSEERTDFEQFVAAGKTLIEHLTEQLQVAGLNEDERLAAVEIIGNLDEDGYFRADITEIAEDAKVSIAVAERALLVVQGFDPAGIASRTFADCVLTQLPGVGASLGEIEQIKELFDHFSAELAGYRYDEIERKLGFDRENLDDLLALIRRTDPRPGASFVSSASYITPDVYILRDGDNYEVAMNEQGLPPLRLNKYYLKAIKQAGLDGATKEYIEEKLKDALWVLKSLQKRQKAIYKVTRAIIDVQKDYLAKGDEYLKPLRLKDIAEKTELHESTVSRVTSGKYAFSPRGLVELKSFFSKGMDSDDGEDVSTRRIKSIIRTMVEEEPAEAPYSDEKIADMLSKDGVKVARRTVAKYREELKIPTMSQRKRMRR